MVLQIISEILQEGAEGILKGHFFTMGVRDFLAIHWEEVNYVLSFGASLLEASKTFFEKPLGLWISEKRKTRDEGKDGSD